MKGSAVLFRNLASPFHRSLGGTHWATLRMDLLGFPKKRQSLLFINGCRIKEKPFDSTRLPRKKILAITLLYGKIYAIFYLIELTRILTFCWNNISLFACERFFKICTIFPIFVQSSIATIGLYVDVESTKFEAPWKRRSCWNIFIKLVTSNLGWSLHRSYIQTEPSSGVQWHWNQRCCLLVWLEKKKRYLLPN